MQCFTLPYLYCMYSPAIAHPHYSPWLFSFYSSYCGLHCAQAPAPSRSSKAWASQDNATLRQSDRKRLKSFFSGHWGDFKAVSQKQADVVAVFHSLLHWHEHTHTHRSICTHTDTHMPTQRSSHTWHTVTHIGCHAAHSERENVR